MALLNDLGRVPRRLIWDNETGIGRRGRLATGVAGVLRDVGHTGASARSTRSGVQRCRRASQRVLRDVVHARPQLRLAGRFQRPSSTTGSSGRTGVWCARLRSARSISSMPTGRRCWRCRRSHRRFGWSSQIRSGRDDHVRVDSSDYSVDPNATPADTLPSRPTWNVCGSASMDAWSPITTCVGTMHDRHQPGPRRDRTPTPVSPTTWS